MLASKAVTAQPACVASSLNRMNSARAIDKEWFLTDDAAERSARIIRSSIPVRMAIVDIVQKCDSSSTATSKLAPVVSHAGTYLKMAGLTGFQMVCQFVIEARAPVLAMSANRAQGNYFQHLMECYAAFSHDALYLKFPRCTQVSKFNLSHFISLHVR